MVHIIGLEEKNKLDSHMELCYYHIVTAEDSRCRKA